MEVKNWVLSQSRGLAQRNPEKAIMHFKNVIMTIIDEVYVITNTDFYLIK